jgi:hypothetical protein
MDIFVLGTPTEISRQRIERLPRTTAVPRMSILRLPHFQTKRAQHSPPFTQPISYLHPVPAANPSPGWATARDWQARFFRATGFSLRIIELYSQIDRGDTLALRDLRPSIGLARSWWVPST